MDEQAVKDAVFRHAVDHLVDRAGERQVYKDRAEAHRKKERRLHVFFDGKIDEQHADPPHDDLLPRDLKDIAEKLLHFSAQSFLFE